MSCHACFLSPRMLIYRLECSSVTIQRLPAVMSAASYCSALQRSATLCNALQHTALQHTATHILQHTILVTVHHFNPSRDECYVPVQRPCNTPPHTCGYEFNECCCESPCADGTGAGSLSLSPSLFLYLFRSSYISFSRSRTRIGCCSLSYSRALAFVLFPLFLLLSRGPVHARSLSCSLSPSLPFSRWLWLQLVLQL